MPPKKKTPATTGGTEKKKKKQKQPTQRTPQQRVKIIGADGKVRWEWREWPPR